MPHDDLAENNALASAGSDVDLLKHIESLGLKTVPEYVEWCSRHGFSLRTKKDWRERLKERVFLTRPAADARLAQNRIEIRKPELIIGRIFSNELGEDDVTQPYLKAICRACRSVSDSPETQGTFHRVLLHFYKHAGLRENQPVIPYLGRQDSNTLTGGLLAMTRHAREWLRPVERWKPESRNARRQLSSLSRHLFAQWPLPTFMDSVWLKGAGEKALRQQQWFMWLGVGGSLRCLDLPVPYTKRMAHFFAQAPSDSTVEAAIRWGQVLGMGGEPRLARAVIGTRLGTSFEHEDFWIEVLHFFVAHSKLDLAQIGPIIDFVHHQRFVRQVVTIAPGVIQQRQPPQPNFSVKGRTVASLLKLVREWHEDLGRIKQPHAEWCKSGIESFEFMEESGGNVRVWTITELLDSHALVAEGRVMQHCVASYVSSCLHGKSSIWAMEVEIAEEKRKVLTIEVNPATRVIFQARGKCNVRPSEKQRDILRRWAQRACLQVAKHV